MRAALVVAAVAAALPVLAQGAPKTLPPLPGPARPPAASAAAPSAGAPRRLPSAMSLGQDYADPKAARRDGAVDLAYGAYQRGLYMTAFREATTRVERDGSDAAAMTLLAELLNQGLGVRPDAREAASWYRLAADRGEPHAMVSLGLMAADGRGVARDPAAARRWFELAASKGEPTAAYNLALLLLAAGSEPELRRAAELLRVAAEAEIGDAQHDLGVLSAKGRGVPQDKGAAALLFLRAAKNGSVAGEVEYAIALVNGDGVDRDETFAARMFLRAAMRGNAIAQNRLARLFATGRGIPRNPVEAAAWHLVAAAQGLRDAWLDAQVRELPQADRTRAEQLATALAALY